MRRALCLLLILGLAACANPAKDGDETEPAAGTSPVSADAGGIEVTPLGAPGSAASVAEGAPLAASPTIAAAAAGTTAPAPAASAVPVQVATAATPHPKPRPAGLEEAAAATEAGTAEEGAAAEEPPPPPPKSQPQIACETGGGIWGKAGEAGGFICQKRLKDGGKSCSKQGDCSGQCLARSQTCAPVSPLWGCNDVLDARGREVTLCID